jgi:hypothetical protein
MASRVKNSNIEVWNGVSFVQFSGVIKSKHAKLVKIIFSDGSILKCSLTHRVKLKERDHLGRFQPKFIKAKDLKGFVTSTGLTVASLEIINHDINLYDLSDVDEHEYLSNSVISHNCEFLSDDQLLIKSITLQGMKEHPPIILDKGFSFWKEIDPHKTYMIGADVAEGVEQDYSTVEVFELETLEQVAEFRSNAINETQLYNALKFVIQKILSVRDKRSGKPPTLYWSFENNSAGAAIATLFYNDEKFPEEAELISGKETRTGFRTVNKPKLEAARQLKNMTEKVEGGMKFRSKTLIFELKNYIARGASYAAKQGATDDLVSAVLIIMRIMKKLSEYEPEIFDKIYKTDNEFYEETTNDFEDPVPFFFS